jgi:hypothetical protein
MVCLLLIERRKRKKKRNSQGTLSQGRNTFLAVVPPDFPGSLVQLKAGFGSILEFYVHLM